MNEIEKSLEISNVFSDAVSLFRHQVPGVEIGFDVLTGFALIFTAIGFFISASKDRENTSVQELSKISDKLFDYIQQSENIFLSIEPSGDVEKYIVSFQNFLYFELTPSIAKWMSNQKAIKATRKVNNLTYKVAEIQVALNDYLSLVDENPYDDEKHVQDKKKQKEETFTELGAVLTLTKDLFLFINNMSQMPISDAIDNNSSYIHQSLQRLTPRLSAFANLLKWPVILILTLGVSFYILINHANIFVYIAGLLVLLSVFSYFWMRYFNNNKVNASKDENSIPLKYGKIDGPVVL